MHSSSSYTFSTALNGHHQGSPSEGQIEPYLELLNYQGKLPSMFELSLPMGCCLYFSRTKKVAESIEGRVDIQLYGEEFLPLHLKLVKLSWAVSSVSR